ncbi:MAG: sugar transferase [Gemmatimonadaceae bacterium]|nr:sugar transferase [Gemmatimonadaceae bacterium]
MIELSEPQSAGDRPVRHTTPPPRRAGRLKEGRDVTTTVERPRSVTAAAQARRDDVIEVIPNERSERLNRLMNFSIAGLALLLVSPVMVLIAIAIRLTSRGPIIYAQARVGLDRRWRDTLALRDRRAEDLGGQVFTIFKFRTMRVDAERFSGAVWAQENDPRVTRLGKFLRQFRLDELPQLWNIMRGDMNIVGPRPERPSIVARLREMIPEYKMRHRVKPGLTGLAQINQHYDQNLDDVRGKVRWDLEYIRTQDMWLDLAVMFKTVPSVLLRFRGW